MTDQTPTANTIRFELVDLANGFLKNPRIIGEKMERKREFLQKKGLTDTEINHAFQLMTQQDTPKQIIANHQSSFLHRIFSNLAFAGFLVLAIRMIKHLFHSDQSDQKNELNETLKKLQTVVLIMRTSAIKLEQTADQLNTTIQRPDPNRSLLEEIKREIQGLTELFSSRSQVPSWQSDKTKNNQTTIDNDNDGIIVLLESDKKSDENSNE